MIYDAGGPAGFLAVGTIGRAHGLKGHVKVRPLTDDPERFLSLARVWLAQGSGYAPLQVAEADVAGEAVTLRLEGVADRTAAEALNGKILYVKREEAVELPPGRYFIADMIGCSVADDAGGFLGKLCEILQPGAADVWVLRGGPRGEVMFPALKAVVLSVDTQARRITVDAARFKEVAVFED